MPSIAMIHATAITVAAPGNTAGAMDPIRRARPILRVALPLAAFADRRAWAQTIDRPVLFSAPGPGVKPPSLSY